MTPAAFREARKAGGYTQKGLATALRMGKHGWQTISKWESDSFDGDIPGPVQVAMEHLLNCGTKGGQENAGKLSPETRTKPPVTN